MMPPPPPKSLSPQPPHLSGCLGLHVDTLLVGAHFLLQHGLGGLELLHLAGHSLTVQLLPPLPLALFLLRHSKCLL